MSSCVKAKQGSALAAPGRDIAANVIRFIDTRLRTLYVLHVLIISIA